MEKNQQREMKTYVLSCLLNVGIGFVLGLIIGLILGGIIGGLLVALEMAVGFSFISVNLYYIYFDYKLSLDVNAVCAGDGVENESSLVASVLSLITFGLYGVYWNYKLAQRLRANAPRYGFKMNVTGKEIAALSVFSFGYISTYELIRTMNRIAKVYNEGSASNDYTLGGVQ